MADFTWKPIEEIKEGEYVIGVKKDSKYKHLGLVKSKVIAVVSRKDLIYRVTTDRGVICLTDNHPILSRYSRWLAINPKRADVKSYTLKVGHKLRYFATPLDTLNDFNEDYASVLKIEPLSETEVFNIQTETENYIAEGFIVHNCFVYQLYDIIGRDMDSETVNALIDFAHKNLDPNGGIWFFGGEPLASFDTMKLIVEKAMANRVASNFGTTTNLYLLSPDKIEWMAKRNVNILASLDGTAEIHDKCRTLRGGAPTWEKCWNNLKTYMKITGKTPEMRWTIQTTDIDVLEKTPEAMKFMVDQGFRSLAMDFVYEVKIDEDILKAIEKMMKEIVKILDAYYSQGTFIHTMMVRDAYSALTANQRAGYISRCGLALGDVGIAPNGKIYPCHRFVASASEELFMGTLWEGFSPKRIELNEKWSKYPPYSEKPELCLTCRFKNACHGGCIAANYDLFGDLHIVPKTFCLIKNINVSVFEPLIRKHETFIAKHIRPTVRECVE